MPVERGVKINFDLENTPLEIKTDSVAAAGSSEYIRVDFFRDYVSGINAYQTYAGGVKIFLTYPPKYFLVDCSLYSQGYNFQNTPTTEVNNVWRITLTRDSVTRGLVIHCNEMEVLNVLLSDNFCEGRSDWSTYWNRDVTKIKFSSSDTASDFYKIYTPG